MKIARLLIVCSFVLIETIFLQEYAGKQSIAIAADENLNEVVSRQSRLAAVSWGPNYLENISYYYIWNPESLQYTDILYGTEVWRVTYAPTGVIGGETQDLSSQHWSADGNRLMVHTTRTTHALNPAGNTQLWMHLNTDGSHIRLAPNTACTSYGWDAYILWSPILADVLYQGGCVGYDAQANIKNGLYKVITTDTSESASLFLTATSSITRMILPRAISGDGSKIVGRGNGLMAPMTVYPEGSKQLDSTNGYDEHLNYDWYWGQGSDGSWSGYHGQFLVGAVNGIDGVWNYLMPENGGGSWWRARTVGTRTNNAPVHTISLTPTYIWGGYVEPVNTLSNSLSANTPWCPEGVVAGTDCVNYPGHSSMDRWGRYMVFSDGGNGLFAYYGVSIADNRAHKYIVGPFYGITNPQHTDWSAWSDWSAADGGPDSSFMEPGFVLTIQNYVTSKQKTITIPHQCEFSGQSNCPYNALARPVQSPDGTKIIFNSSFLNASDNEWNLYWAVAYYPYPPQIQSAAKVSSNVRLAWDFNQGTSCATQSTNATRTGPTPNLSTPRTYATRGWPHETLDCPPSPREIKQFRVWSSPDNSTWTPIGTTNYLNCSGTNECGMWTAFSWTFDVPQGNNATTYYAITSVEHSGLESHRLSNTWKVITDGSNNITSQVQQTAYPSTPGGKTSFYSTAPSAPGGITASYKQAPATANGQYTIVWTAPASNTLIRHYNIYAHDGSAPSATQQMRIASIPATACNGTSCSYIDWAGNTNGLTQYAVTSVDFQGNESGMGNQSNAARPTAPTLQ